MARVELNIVALGDFKSVNSQIKALQDQVNLLNKSVASVGVNANLSKQLNEANAAFKATMLSTGQFTAQTVRLKAETDKFGEALVNGKLKLTQYFQIIKSGTTNATAQMKALAMEQTKLQNSMVMSDPTKQGVLSVYTPTKINAISNATKIAANTQNLYNIAVDKGTQSLINWGKNTQWAGRQLTVGMTVPLTIFGSTATQVFQQVNDEIVRLQKVYGTGLQQPTQAALDSIKQQVLGLSKELASGMGIAVKDTAAMAADLAATGLQGVDLINATRESMRLQKLGEMDQQSAMQTTISLQNVYKLNTNQLSGAINFLNAVENQTSTSMQDLAAGIPKVGPIVQQLGGSFKDTAIMMVAMKEAGVPAAQSANAIKSALASLINPTKAAKDAFAAYNINLASIATKTGGNPVQMIMMLQQALKGLQPLAQAQLIEKLFGKFQEARIQALITNLGAVNSQTKQAFDLMNASDTQLNAIAAGELKTATESVTGKFRRAVETMKADLLPVGEKIMQVATSLLNFGNSIAKTFGGLPGPVKTVLGIIAAGVALSGPIIMFTGVLANFVGYLIKGLFSMKDLINGTKTFGQLFTPEIIASQNAAQLFSQKILQDESAVMLLNKAVRELTVSLEGMAAGMAAASGTGLAEKLLIAEAGLAGGRIPFRAPKMATGGIVPGSPSAGDVYPALLMGGESVIPTEQTKKYGPFINAMINGTLPKFGDGTTPGGSSRPSAAFTQAEKVYGLMPGIRETQLSIIAKEIASMREAGISISSKSEKEMLFGNISHVSPREGAMPKDWSDYSKMYALTAPENQALNLLTRPNSKNNVAAFGKSMENAIMTMVNEGFNESELKSVAKGILAGKQPIEKLELKLFQTALNDIDKRVTSGELRPGKNFGSRTLPWIKSASSITEARLSGKLPMPEQMRLDLNAATKAVSQPFANSPKFESKIDLTSRDNARSSGSYTRTHNLIMERIKKDEELAKQINIESESASPSKATKRAAKNMVDGAVEGLKAGKPAVRAAANVAMEEALLASAGGGEYTNLATETEPGLAATSRQGERFAKFNAARMAARAKLTSRLPKMMTGRFAGLGMGLGLQVAGQFASPLINKLPGGSIANDAITGASYGAFLGPEGALAGAAIGGIIGGISKLMDVEKMHKANAEATFKASADAIKMFGGATEDLSTPIINLDKIMGSALPKVDALKSQVANFKDEIAKLPKDNPMQLILKQMQDAGSSSKAAAIATAFANTQVAINGMDPAAAQKMIDLYMAAAGYSSKPGSVKAPTVKEATQKLLDVATLPTIELSQSVDSTATTQTENDKNQEKLKTNIKNVANSMINAGASQKDYKDKLDAIKASQNDTTKAVEIYANSLDKKHSSTKNAALELAKYKLTLSQVVPFLKLASVQPESPILAQIIKDAKDPNGAKKLAEDMKLLNAEVDKLLNKKPSSTTNLNPDGTPLTADQIAADRITALQKKYKPILDLENKRTTELERQKALMDAQNTAAQDAINYATQQTDLQSQIRQAMAGGDYLKANLLRQQMAGAADKYQMGVISNQNAQVIDKGRQMYADAQAKIAEGKSLTAAEVKALQGYNPKLGTYNVGSVNMPAAVQYGNAAQLGTTGANIPAINVVINGSSLTPAQLEAAAKNAVTGALAQAGVKTSMSGTTNKVGK